MNWQPIETAPRDCVVIVWDGNSISVAEYSEGGLWLCEADGRAVFDHMGYDWDEGREVRPTHWMPLPEPPA